MMRSKRSCGVYMRAVWVAIGCAIVTLHVVVGTAQLQTKRLTPAQVAIPSTYFGMHVHTVLTQTGFDPKAPWPQVTVPSWRLWDVHVSWTEIAFDRGQYNFGVLDRVLKLAQEHNTEVQLTFGFTPRWASARPTEKSLREPGNAAEPQSIDDWKDFVRATATRYRGQIHIYEIWNEPNNPRYWSGSVEQLVELSHQAHDIIKSIDPSAIIVSPSPVQLPGLVWLSHFLSAGGGRYVDVIGFHFYVDPNPPEAILPLIQTVQAIMRGNGVGDKPLWNTEAGWAQPHPFPSDELAAAYLARAFLLNWASGVSRFYWYGWNSNGSLFVATTNADNTLNKAGTAYGVIQKWLTGSVMNGCGQDSNHNWTCQLKDGAVNKWVVWNTDQDTCFAIPDAWAIKHVTPLLSEAQPAKSGCLQIGAVPQLLTR